MGKTGYDYAPSSKTLPPVVGPGEFVFSVTGLDHGHIFGQTNGLIDAGGTLKYVYDADPKKVEDFLGRYPQAKAVDSLDAILADDETVCVASASVPCDRAPLGVKALRAGKHYFTDKSPFTALDQLAEVYVLRDKPDAIARIRELLFVDTLHVKRIPLNTCTVEELAAHVYVNWDLARTIVAYRDQHGPFRQREDLLGCHRVDSTLFRKLAPYLQVP